MFADVVLLRFFFLFASFGSTIRLGGTGADKALGIGMAGGSTEEPLGAPIGSPEVLNAGKDGGGLESVLVTGAAGVELARADCRMRKDSSAATTLFGVSRVCSSSASISPSVDSNFSKRSSEMKGIEVIPIIRSCSTRR